MMVGLQILASAIVALVLLCPAEAAVFNITAGDVTALINAINTANGNNEDDTINLAAGTYTLTAVDNDTDGAGNGLPLITSTITMRGAGANRTVLARAASAPEFRIIDVHAPGVLMLDGLTLSGGGGVFFFAGIFNAGTLTLLNSGVSNTSGAIANAGTLTLLNSSVSRNDAGSFGQSVAGIENGGTATLLNSSVSDNFGRFAGAISNGGRMTLTNTTVSGNAAPSDGTGAIQNDGGTVTLVNSTVSDNHASQGRAGILSEGGGTVEMTHTIVVGNTIRGFSPEEVPDDCFNGLGFSFTSPGQFISRGHNLVGVGTGCPSDGPGDLTVDPADVFTMVLGPLQNNGGPTPTHALLPGSPAIDAGNATCTDASGNPLTTDQRGKPRPVDGNGDGISACDIGAFELFPTVNGLVALARELETSFNSNPVPGGPVGTFTVTAVFTNTGATPLRFLFFGVSQLSGGNLLLDADGGPGGVGATLTPKITGDTLAPGAEVTATFVIGLQQRTRFNFFVNVFAEPLH